MIDRIRIHLFWKVAIYYGVCFALVLTAGLTHPEWMNYLPFGGLDALQKDMTPFDDGNLVGQLVATDRSMLLFDDAMNLISALTGALVVMVPLRWLYITESLKKSWSGEVTASLLMLPLVVTAIVHFVKFSLPLAFALAGIFAGVMYRSTLKSQSDAYFCVRLHWCWPVSPHAIFKHRLGAGRFFRIYDAGRAAGTQRFADRICIRHRRVQGAHDF